MSHWKLNEVAFAKQHHGLQHHWVFASAHSSPQSQTTCSWQEPPTGDTSCSQLGRALRPRLSKNRVWRKWGLSSNMAIFKNLKEAKNCSASGSKPSNLFGVHPKSTSRDLNFLVCFFLPSSRYTHRNSLSIPSVPHSDPRCALDKENHWEKTTKVQNWYWACLKIEQLCTLLPKMRCGMLWPLSSSTGLFKISWGPQDTNTSGTLAKRTFFRQPIPASSSAPHFSNQKIHWPERDPKNWIA